MDNSLLAVRDINHKYIVVDRRGKFTFKNLNPIQWANKRLTLEAYVVDSFYNDDNESYTLKEVNFIVQY